MHYAHSCLQNDRDDLRSAHDRDWGRVWGVDALGCAHLPWHVQPLLPRTVVFVGGVVWCAALLCAFFECLHLSTLVLAARWAEVLE